MLLRLTGELKESIASVAAIISFLGNFFVRAARCEGWSEMLLCRAVIRLAVDPYVDVS